MVRTGSIHPHSVQIIPAVLVCSGQITVPPGAKRKIYKKPYVKIRTTPRKKIEERVEWYDDVSITVPILYDEATQAEDNAIFNLQVTDKENKEIFRDEYKSNDTYCRFDQLRKSLRIILPRPTEKKKKSLIKYRCYVEVSLDIKSRVSEYHKRLSGSTNINVEIHYELGRVYDDETDFIVYAGINVDSEFEPKLTLQEWEELMEKKQYEDWLYQRYLNDRYSHLEVDEEDGF